MNKMNKVTQFQLHGWLDNLPQTNSIVTGLISMIAEIQKVQCLSGTNDDPMIIHCRYTYVHTKLSYQEHASTIQFFSTTLARSSTFCAIFTALEQLRVKQSADISQLVRSFYTNNPEVTCSMVRKPLYLIVANYICVKITFTMTLLLNPYLCDNCIKILGICITSTCTQVTYFT